MQGLIKSAIVSKLLPSKQIVGFDKVDALPYFKHPISTIEVPVEKMVGQTIDLLSNMPQSGGTYLARANYLKSNN